MYSVYIDKNLIHDLDSENNVLVNPTLELELNKAGSFTFSMECTHPYYDKLERFKSIVQVLCDGDEIFKGRIIEITDDMYKERTVYCESELAYLNDSIQRPHEYQLASTPVRRYLEDVIAEHNEQVDDNLKFTVGIVDMEDPNNYLYCYTNYDTTMESIKEDLVDDYGGYIRVRNDYVNNNPLGELRTSSTSNGRYLDYIPLDEYGNRSTQYIEFGENLLDFTSDIDQTDICTGIIPLGATLEESQFDAIDERLTIKDVNGGVDYLYIPEAVEKYGLILKTVTWDDITVASNLLTAARVYLANMAYDDMTITATAVDMHITNEEIATWRLGDMIRVISEPHDLDEWFPLAQMSIPLDQPENTSVTLGTFEDTSLSARTNEVRSGLRDFEDFTVGNVIASAVAQATALIQGATHGYVTLNFDDDGHPFELLIMDAPEIGDAKKLWRWNMGGLGYTDGGYEKGDYALAMTMDGHILGTLLIANGAILADDRDVEFGKFTDDGMRIYAQAGRDDLLLMRVGLGGMEVYNDQSSNPWLMTQIDGQGFRVYDSNGTTRTNMDNNSFDIYDSSGTLSMTLEANGLKNYDSDGVMRAYLSRTAFELFHTNGNLAMSMDAYSFSTNYDNGKIRFLLSNDGLVFQDDSENYIFTAKKNGTSYYNNGDPIGTIGTSNLESYPNEYGLMFDLEYGDDFMCFSHRDSSSASVYTIKFAYYAPSCSYPEGIVFGDNARMNNYKLYLHNSNSDGYFQAVSGGGGGFYGGDFYFNDGLLYYNRYEVATKNDIAGLSLLANGEEAEGDFSLYSGLQLDISELVNYKSSDETLKTSIQPLNDARVDNITPVTFRWKSGDDTAHYGYIAQEVREHIPEIVKESDDGLLSLAYTEIIPLLHAKINTLEERIAKLEAIIYGKEKI